MRERPVDRGLLFPDGHGPERHLRRDEDRQLLPRRDADGGHVMLTCERDAKKFDAAEVIREN